MKQGSSAWFGPASLAAIIVCTLVPLIIVSVIDVRVDEDPFSGAILVGVFAVVSVSDLLIARFVLLPPLVKDPESTQESATSLGYAFAVVPAIFGIVASVYTGQALLALPFGAFALLSWAIMRRFLREAYQDDRRSRMREH